MEEYLHTLFKELPIAGVMCLFGWALLQIFKQVIQHYQHMIDEHLENLTKSIDKLANNCNSCPGNNQRRKNNDS